MFIMLSGVLYMGEVGGSIAFYTGEMQLCLQHARGGQLYIADRRGASCAIYGRVASSA